MADDRDSKFSSTRREKTSIEQPQREELLKAREYLDLAEVMFVALGSDGIVEFANRKCCEILGYDYDEVIGKDWFKTFLPKRFRKETRDVFRSLMKGRVEPVEHFENQVLTKDSEERMIAWHNTVMKDSKGRIDGILSSGEDITERKRAERAVQRSEERFRTIFEESPIGIDVFDSDGILIEGNKACLDVFGVSLDDLRGFYLFDDPNVPEEAKKRIRNGETVRYQAPFDFEKVKERGSYDTSKSGIAYLNTVITPFGSDEDGSFRGYIVQMQDVTERKIVEEALKTSKQRYQDFLMVLPEAVGITDLDENFTYVNQAFTDLLGYTMEELVQKNVFDLISAEGQRVVRAETERRKHHVASTYELQMIRKDGELRLVEVSTMPQKDDEGNVIGTIGVISDITEQKNAEKALRESEQRYKELIEMLPQGVAMADLDEVISLVNKEICNILGYDSEELMGKPLFDFVDVRDAKKMMTQTERRARGVISSYDLRMIHKTGGVRDIQVSAAPKRNNAGEVNGAIGIFVDITESKRTQRNLRKRTYELNERLKEIQVLYELSDLLKNPEQPLDVVLTAALEIVVRGFQYPEVTCGRVTLEGIEHRSADFMETPWLLSEEIWVDGKKAGMLDINYMELRPEADEGPFHAEERALMVTVSREIGQYIEHQRSQSRLSETMQKLQAVTDSTLDAIVMVNQEERIVFWNAAAEKLFGYSDQEIIGRHLHQTIIPEVYSEAATKGFRKFKTTGRGPAIGKVVEMSGKRKDSAEFPIELSLSAIPFGDLWGAVGTIRDITERKQNEEQRRQQHSELEVYASLLRHDLKNDVGVILGNVDLAKMIAGEDDTEMLETLSSTEAICERMMNLLKAVGRPADSIEKNIAALVRSVSSQAQEAHAILTVNVTVDDDAEALAIGSNRLLPMVFENLLRNAAAHAGEKPIVDIIVSKEGSNVQVLVSDNGPGVPEEVRNRLFHRGASTSGGGLGLYLSKSIVNAMNGSIELMDTDSGVGATFKILLPLTV